MIDKYLLVETFLELVKINGESGNERGPADYIKKKLSELGVSYEEDNAGKVFGGNQGNVIGRYSGTDKNLPPIFFSCHMDTIEPTTKLRTVIENGTIRTGGTSILGADNRAGISIVLTILDKLVTERITCGPLFLLFTVGEEIGMYGSKNLSGLDSGIKCGFVFDSSAEPGKIIVSAPAASKLNIRVLGKSAHAAVQPESGVNAIKIASEAITNIEIGRVTPTCTVNFGKINGGKAINIVPDEILIEGEARSVINDELQLKINEIQSVYESIAEQYNGKVEFEIVKKYPAFKLSEKSDTVVIAKQAVAQTGLVPETIVYPGGSDANIFNSFGIETVNLGIGFKNVHSREEFIEIENLYRAANIGLNIIHSCVKHFSDTVEKVP